MMIWISGDGSRQPFILYIPFSPFVQVDKNHPRYRSLIIREKMSEMVDEGIVAPTGLIAHGRGEAFDYLMGEMSTANALRTERAAVACLLQAKHPVLSVNGNTAALCARETVTLSEIIPARIEVNLFHRTEERVEKVCRYLEKAGANGVLGRKADGILPGVASDRARCTKEGIQSADVVLVPLEDGDRAQALVAAGKQVIAIDLNPLSRTAQVAHFTIVDEASRALGNMISMVPELKNDHQARKALVSSFSNKRNLQESVALICRRLQEIATEGKS